MAQAVGERFEEEGPVYFAGGPPIEDGFYYDFLLPRKLEQEDLIWIKNRMKDVILESPVFLKEIIDEQAAREKFSDQLLSWKSSKASFQVA